MCTVGTSAVSHAGMDLHHVNAMHLIQENRPRSNDSRERIAVLVHRTRVITYMQTKIKAFINAPRCPADPGGTQGANMGRCRPLRHQPGVRQVREMVGQIVKSHRPKHNQ
jgi:hypothetical protein